MNKSTYTIKDLCFNYGSTPTIHNLSLSFQSGQFHGILGPNGSGKSTLLDLMAGHRQPTSGTITINEAPINELAPSELAILTALVPQDTYFNFPFTVHDAVLMGRHPHIPRFARPTDNDLKIVNKVMDTMDISPLADRGLFQLSGGEKQRTVVARALAQATPCLLLDEPTSSMDIRHALAALSEFRRLAHKEGHTVIAVLHDLNLAAAYCDTVTILQKGRLHRHGTAEAALTAETINDVFSVTAEVSQNTRNNSLAITYHSKETL